jgi:hypothetical protein
MTRTPHVKDPNVADPANVFVHVDRQNEFVERWTVFAGLWFEEIEPRLGTAQRTGAGGGA